MVNIPRIKTTKNSVWYSIHKNRRACGVSLWSEHKTKSLQGGGSCPEAEIQIVRFGNPRTFRSGWMSTRQLGQIWLFFLASTFWKNTPRLKQVCSNILKNCPNPASKQCLPNITLESFFQSQTRLLQQGRVDSLQCRAGFPVCCQSLGLT